MVSSTGYQLSMEEAPKVEPTLASTEAPAAAEGSSQTPEGQKDAEQKKRDRRRKKKERQKQNKAAAKPAPGEQESGEKEPVEDKEKESADAINPVAAIAAAELAKKRLKKEGLSKEHKFWDTQPVPKMEEVIDTKENAPFERKTLADVPKDPYPILSQFTWCETDVDDPATLDEIYTLLYENYVEDDDCMFRFDYSREFLKWALKPPGYRRDWHVGVRRKTDGKLVAFITAIPALISVRGKKTKMVEINFLCVQKKLREHRLAPLLIKEITRRVNLTDVWQAVYTAGVLLPKPVGKCRYFHRSLNPKKLVNIGFSHLPRRQTIKMAIRLNKVPDQTATKGLREAQLKDVPQIVKLLGNYLKKTALHPVFDEEEVAHWFLPRPNIVNCWVVENDKHKITDMISFYTLPSTVIGNTTYNTLKAAYSFYNVSTTTPLNVLMQDALILANKLGYDVFNCLDLMDNASFLDELKFHPGDGNLHYYLYNWKCAEMQSNEVGLVLM